MVSQNALKQKKELIAFRDFDVYEEVVDEGQDRLNPHWVLHDKSKTEGKVKIKARLVIKGFEEKIKEQSDSPTGSRETLHILLTAAASKGWEIKSGDVKNAYLQGEVIDRKLFMDPPPERKKDGVIWKLNKSVYGLNYAGRKWFKKIGETLTQLGCKKSKFDHCLFTYWKESQLEGIILLWVDDIFHAGTKKLDRDIIKKVADKFKIGNTEKLSFTLVLI